MANLHIVTVNINPVAGKWIRLIYDERHANDAPNVDAQIAPATTTAGSRVGLFLQ
jgi:hypothetical protein